jgi:hypothetical protein
MVQKFNTKIDVGSAISKTQQHKVLLEYAAQENHTLAFAALSAKQKQVVHEDAEECYISYAFLHQSGAQHGNPKVDLRNDFTTSSNQYPKTCQQTLHLLNKQVQQHSCLLCPRQLHPKDHHSLKKVVEVAEVAKTKVA